MIASSTLVHAGEVQNSLPANSIRDGILTDGVYGFKDISHGDLIKVSLGGIRNSAPNTSLDIRIRRHGDSYGCRLQSISETELACNNISLDKKINLSISLKDQTQNELDKNFLLNVKFSVKGGGRFFPKINQKFTAKLIAE